MSRWWLALVPEVPAGATAARVYDETGGFAGVLACWSQRAKPVRSALRVDGRVVDSAGEPAWVSLVLAPAGMQLPFDDVSVQWARRRVLAHSSADAVSTLLRDSAHFEGAVTVARGAQAPRVLGEDPFARIFPSRVLRCDAGLLGRTSVPTGPAIERYGGENPWPWDRFPADVYGRVTPAPPRET